MKKKITAKQRSYFNDRICEIASEKIVAICDWMGPEPNDDEIWELVYKGQIKPRKTPKREYRHLLKMRDYYHWKLAFKEYFRRRKIGDRKIKRLEAKVNKMSDIAMLSNDSEAILKMIEDFEKK